MTDSTHKSRIHPILTSTDREIMVALLDSKKQKTWFLLQRILQFVWGDEAAAHLKITTRKNVQRAKQVKQKSV